jgi:hypothetical protein
MAYLMDPFSFHTMDQFNSLVQSQHDSSAAMQASLSYYDPHGLYLEPNGQKAMNFPHAPSSPSSMATCQSSEVMPSMSCASGPSVPSASSSAIGSPYMGAAQGFQEPWVDNPPYTSGLSPSTLLPEFIGCGVDTETPLSPEKYPTNPHNFVGECDRISSSIKSPSTVSLSRLQCSEPVSASPCSIPFSGGAPPKSPRFSVSASGSMASSTTPVPTFRSPGPPSPELPFRRRSLQPLVPSSGTKQARTSASLSPETPKSTPVPFHGHFQHSFFSQSSGNFVPPLESSCRFFHCPLFCTFNVSSLAFSILFFSFLFFYFLLFCFLLFLLAALLEILHSKF